MSASRRVGPRCAGAFRLWIPVLSCLGLGAAGPQDPVREAAMLQRAAELAEPAPAHARLARLLGSWVSEVTTIGADGRERTDRGTIEGTQLLGGRYVQLHHRLATAGGAIEALQVLGFHTLHEVYTSSWRDDHSTWSVDCSGAPDAAAPDRLALHGTLVDARSPTGRAFRLELDLGVADAVGVRLFDTVDGGLVLRQTQRWTRR